MSVKGGKEHKKYIEPKDDYTESVWVAGSRAAKESSYAYFAAAIVRQAVNDYVKVISKLWQKNCSITQRRNLMLTKVELEEFFSSEWYACLTDIDPEMLMARCKLIAREKQKQIIQSRNRARIRREHKMPKMLREKEK